MNIQSNIRKFILNWALKLEEDGILGEGIQFSKRDLCKIPFPPTAET